jgi:hypothetical protein
MVELEFDYGTVCACIPAGINIKGEESKKYQPLIVGSIQGSLSAVGTPEFQAQFKDSPDNIETQVDMYAALLDDVCARLSRGVQRVESDKTKSQEIAFAFENVVRATYATIGGMELAKLTDGTPLFAEYLQKRLGDKKPTTKAIEEIVSDYMSKLKVKEFLDEQGTTPQLLAQLEAALL